MSDTLNHREKHFISYFDTYKNGYNMTDGSLIYMKKKRKSYNVVSYSLPVKIVERIENLQMETGQNKSTIASQILENYFTNLPVEKEQRF